MNHTFKTSLQVFKRAFDLFTYYSFVVDLYLLEYFSRKSPYCVFIFCYFYGTFGYTDGLTDLQFVGKVFCLVFSWYLIFTSIMVFCVFNVSVTKKYLYDLLGKDFVVSKIGNPGWDAATRFGGFAVLGLAVNEGGKFVDGRTTVINGNDFLGAQLTVIEESPYLSPKQKSLATQQALKAHYQMAQKAPEGTLDRVAKIEAHRDMVSKATKAIKSFWGK